MAMKSAMESFAKKFVECLSPILQADKARHPRVGH